MSDLIAFLTVALDEDEAVAREVADDDEARSHVGSGVLGAEHYDRGAGHTLELVGMSAARVLADVAAKRAIVDRALNYSPELERGDNGEWAFDIVLRLLAQPYADRPGFDPAWRV